MGLLEETLRDTFAHRAGAPPAIEGLADRAIVGAQKARRRSAVMASTAAVLSVALIAFGALTVATRPEARNGTGPAGPTGAVTATPTPTPSMTAVPPATAAPLDVVVGGTVYLAGGGTRALPDLGSGEVTAAWQVVGGYLVSTYEFGAPQPSASLWYVPLSGAPSLLESGEAVMVAAGTLERPGVQIGWRDDAGVHVGVFAGGAVTGIVSTEVPDVEIAGARFKVRLYPQTVVGGSVVLAGTMTGGGLDVWDVWFPGRGRYVATTGAAPFVPMLAATADGEHIIGSYYPGGNKPGCLGEFDPDGFGRVRELCPTVFSLDGDLLPSPDGRWWLVTDPQQLRLYDAQQVWQGANALYTWAGAEVGDGAWVDASTAVLATKDGVVVVHTDGRPLDVITIPAAAQLGVNRTPIVVADLR